MLAPISVSTSSIPVLVGFKPILGMNNSAFLWQDANIIQKAAELISPGITTLCALSFEFSIDIYLSVISISAPIAFIILSV